MRPLHDSGFTLILLQADRFSPHKAGLVGACGPAGACLPEAGTAAGLDHAIDQQASAASAIG